MFSCARRSSAASSMVTRRSLLRNVLRQNVQKVVLPAPVPPEMRMLMRAFTARGKHLHHLRRDALQLDQLVGGQRAGAEAADGQRGPVERQRRNDGVDARAVGQAGIDHRRGLVHSAAHARDDAVDDLQQMAVVAEGRIDPLQKPALFNEDMVLVVDQDVGDLRIAQQRLQRAEAEDFVEQIGLDLFLLVEVQRHALVGDDLLDDAGHRLARLAGIDARQLLQIQLGDQGPVYFRFVLFQIQQFHVVPSVECEIVPRHDSVHPKSLKPFFLWLRRGCAGNRAGHLPDQPGNGGVRQRQRRRGVLHLPHGGIIVGNLPVRRNSNRLINQYFTGGRPKLEIVINRYEPRALGVADEPSPRRSPGRELEDSQRLCRGPQMQNTATPLALGDSPIARLIKQMATSICGTAATQPKKKGFRLFG